MPSKIKPNLKTYILFIITFFVSWFILTGIFRLVGGSSTSNFRTFLFLIFKSILFIGLPYLYVKLIRKENFIEYIGFRLPTKRQVYLYSIPTILIISGSLMAVFLDILSIDSGVYLLLSAWVAGLIVAPIVEEIAFRGLIFTEGSKLLNNKLNWLLNAVLFILIHSSAWIYYPERDHRILAFSVTTFFFNYVLIWSYIRTKSIYPPILVHFLNNFLSIFILAS